MATLGIDLRDHFCLKNSEDIDTICQPLFSTIGMDYFCFISIDSINHKRFFLTNKANWLHYFYKNGFYSNSIIIKAEHFQNFTSYIWDDYAHEKPFTDGRAFDIISGITIINSNQKQTNIYCFGSSQPQNSHFYLTKIDYFHHFIGYFHDRAAKLIADAKKYAFVLPDYQVSGTAHTGPINIELNHFLSKIKPERIYISNEHYLTQKEALCAYLLMQGKTAKIIGKELRISNRTVENHIYAIKERLGCATVSSLVGELLQSCFIKQILHFGDRELTHMIKKTK